MKHCPICQSPLKKFIKTKQFLILKCSRCGFGLTDNLSAQSRDYHRDDSYLKEEFLFKNIFQKRIKKISQFIKNGRALEVGCSTGLMLELLKNKGWEVAGVEISKAAGEVAISRGIKIYQQKFEKINFSDKYDLVIFNHTLEHLEDFKKALQIAKSILKPKGFLYIDLPNFGSISAGLMKKSWPLLLPKEHLWHFSEKSLNILLRELGFKVVLVNKASGIFDYEKPIRGILKSLIKFKKRFFRETATALPSFIITKLGKGSDLMVIARKK